MAPFIQNQNPFAFKDLNFQSYSSIFFPNFDYCSLTANNSLLYYYNSYCFRKFW
ncbi:hypothetical protein KSS87_000130 [Heliosperma pusillum]|nr:hypothetical protein KSS87_000130 [Heliosperma pusillum]